MLAHTLVPLPLYNFAIGFNTCGWAKALTTGIFEDYTYFWMQSSLPSNWTVRRGGKKMKLSNSDCRISQPQAFSFHHFCDQCCPSCQTKPLIVFFHCLFSLDCHWHFLAVTSFSNLMGQFWFCLHITHKLTFLHLFVYTAQLFLSCSFNLLKFWQFFSLRSGTTQPKLTLPLLWHLL